MGVWRYIAVETGNGSRTRRGEVAGDTAVEVRSSLRRVGLQVIELKPAKTQRTITSEKLQSLLVVESLVTTIHRHLRNRRRSQRCEMYDSLATMMESGIPLLEAVQTACGSVEQSRRSSNSRRRVLVEMRERLKAGAALDEAMKDHPSWFDAIEIAMVSAGQHGGDLPRVLRSLAHEHEQSDALAQKLMAALAYPTIITLVGIGVVMFLSVKTLPDLTQILIDSGVEIPRLTANVMAIGQLVAGHWALLLLGFAACLGFLALAPSLRERFLPNQRRFNWSPALWRRMAVGGLSLRLSALVRTGVPVVDAFRVLAPTVGNRHLRSQLAGAAEQIERGEELSTALADRRWFDDEFRRLLDIGQATGELDVLLERIGARYQRQARRLIDRLASLLEPCVMLVLAVLVGVVVMAAVLPLIRLQDVV